MCRFHMHAYIHYADFEAIYAHINYLESFLDLDTSPGCYVPAPSIFCYNSNAPSTAQADLRGKPSVVQIGIPLLQSFSLSKHRQLIH